MRAHLDEFGALLDVERRDRLTVDKQHHLRLRDGGRGKNNGRCDHRCYASSARGVDRDLRHRLPLPQSLKRPLCLGPPALVAIIVMNSAELSTTKRSAPAHRARACEG